MITSLPYIGEVPFVLGGGNIISYVVGYHSVLWRDTISIVEGVQYCGEIP